MSIRLPTAICGLMILALPGSADAAEPGDPRFATPDPVPDSPALPGDERLDCPTLRAEGDFRLAQHGQLDQEAEAIDYKKGGKTRALETLGTVGGAVPIIGGAISMGALMAQMETTREDAKANYGAIDRKAQWVLDRMSRMHELYRAKCTGAAR
jgi:hypothetical protein